MEEHYMILIYNLFAAKQNESLSPKEKQDKVIEILSLYKKDVEDFTKSKFKKESFKAIESALKDL